MVIDADAEDGAGRDSGVSNARAVGRMARGSDVVRVVHVSDSDRDDKVEAETHRHYRDLTSRQTESSTEGTEYSYHVLKKSKAANTIRDVLLAAADESDHVADVIVMGSVECVCNPRHPCHPRHPRHPRHA